METVAGFAAAIAAGASDPPLHVFRTRVWFDELDSVGVLHNARYAVHAERAMSSWFESRPELDRSEDSHHLVKAYDIDFRAPVTASGELDVELRVAKLGRTSCAYEFRLVGTDGLVHALGHRTVVKIDGARRPAAWTDAFRCAHGEQVS